MSSVSDLHTFKALYRDHHGWLRQYFLKKVNCSEQAADLMQDTFLRILAGKDYRRQVADIREPRLYLTTIARRILVDRFRRMAIERAYIEALAQRPACCRQAAALDISPEERLILMECLLELDAMLMGLGTKVRRAFLLSQLQSMRYADIAAELNISLSTVKRHLARATLHCLLYAHENGLA